VAGVVIYPSALAMLATYEIWKKGTDCLIILEINDVT
jgi:hypothetical protein